MLRFILVLSLASYAICAPPASNGTLEDLYKLHFGNGNQPINNGSNFPDSGGSDLCRGGRCVPHFQCRNNGTVVTNGAGIINKRIGEDSNTEELRCNEPYTTCCSDVLDKKLFPEISVAKGCGYRKYGQSEFPWTVAIFKEENVLDKVVPTYKCGGSLIHPSVILTAAHCVFGEEPATLIIRAGEYDIQRENEIYPHQERHVSDFIIHEQYYDPAVFNDVALLFLLRPVELAENVNTICLPSQDMNFDLQRCFVSGWGKDSFGKAGHYQAIMKWVELPVVPRDKCVRELRTTRLGIRFELDKSFICAGGEIGKDTCEGHGGSPLVCLIPDTVGQYHQIGIVAWGIGCGDSTPGVYVNMPLFRNWIEEKLQQKRITL